VRETGPVTPGTLTVGIFEGSGITCTVIEAFDEAGIPNEQNLGFRGLPKVQAGVIVREPSLAWP
jgi:hypothetical protein